MNKFSFLSREFRTEAPRNDIKCGIVDGEDATPAYTTTDSGIKWIAVVENPLSHVFEFVPIDNNIPIYKADGINMERRCDGMLLCQDQSFIAFVELKDVSTGGTGDAIEQLRITIECFLQNHKVDTFKKRRAYAANAAHPSFAYSRRAEIERFRKMKFALYPQAQIIIP